MWYLGDMYSEGLGVLQDFVEAHRWYNLAASRLTGDQRQGSRPNRRAVGADSAPCTRLDPTMPPTSFDIGFSLNPCPRKLGAPQSTKRSTIRRRTLQPWWPESTNELSGKPGTVQFGTLPSRPRR